jgi:hypothetical protein
MDIGNPLFRAPFGARQVHTEDYNNNVSDNLMCQTRYDCLTHSKIVKYLPCKQRNEAIYNFLGSCLEETVQE